MKTHDLKELSPLEKVTLPTAAMPGRMDSLGRSMKRAPRRILGQFGGENAGGQAYHVMSRTAGGEMVFGEVAQKKCLEEKMPVPLLRKLAPIP
jgi:hypothetical protein